MKHPRAIISQLHPNKTTLVMKFPVKIFLTLPTQFQPLLIQLDLISLNKMNNRPQPQSNENEDALKTMKVTNHRAEQNPAPKIHQKKHVLQYQHLNTHQTNKWPLKSIKTTKTPKRANCLLILYQKFNRKLHWKITSRFDCRFDNIMWVPLMDGHNQGTNSQNNDPNIERTVPGGC